MKNPERTVRWQNYKHVKLATTVDGWQHVMVPLSEPHGLVTHAWIEVVWR